MVLMFWLMSRNKQRDQARREEKRDAALIPGTWLMTTAGFYGRFVDRDGDVIILENLDGQETLWSLRAIVGPVDPPFAETTETVIETETEDLDTETDPRDSESVDSISEVELESDMDSQEESQNFDLVDSEETIDPEITDQAPKSARKE